MLQRGKLLRFASARRPAPGEQGVIDVLFVHSATQPPLGADTFVQSQIAAALDKTRVRVHVACATGNPATPTPTFEVMRSIPGVAVVPVDLGKERTRAGLGGTVSALLGVVPAVVSFVRLVVHVRRQHIAIVHTTDRPRDAAVSVLLARVTGAACIVHAHVGFDPRWMSKLLQWAMHRADALIAISEYVASTLREGGIASDRIHVVPNAIDVDRWKPGEGRQASREELGVGDQVVVLTVCRLFRAKGATELVRALALVHQVRSDVRLVIVGREMENGYVASLKGLAADLHVTDSVTFTGQRNDVPRLMAAADIFAMPSQFEPFGLVYLEAMAMELPVVGLNNGGTLEVVEDGRQGFLSAPGDVRALADNLLKLVGDPQLRRDMGERGRARARDLFPVARLGRGCESVYRLLAFRPGADGTVRCTDRTDQE